MYFIMIRTYKRKLKLTEVQKNRIDSWIGVCRMVYNLGLEIRIDAYKKSQKSVSKFDLMRQVTELRKEYNWVEDVPSDTLSFSIKRLDNAYSSFFKNGKGFPRFAKKGLFRSIAFRNNIHVSGNSVKLQKIGVIKLYKDAPVQGEVKLAYIVKQADGYFVCLTCEVEDSVNISNKAIGIDLGLSNLCITSEGQFISNPRHLKRYERKLIIASRSLSRKKKGSNSRKRQKIRLSKLHLKIANARKDFHHKESTKLANNNSTVYAEDLNVKGMVKNHKLACSISDAGWGNFLLMVKYKTRLVKVNPAYTSQTCNECKAVDKKSRISQSEYVCTSCGHVSHADINAAKNIMSKGIALDRQRSTLVQA